MSFKKIVLHWSAGGPVPNKLDRKHYHYLFDTLGRLHSGEFTPEANLDCSDGLYAAHTGGGNTGAIGIALCGMLGFKSPQEPFRFPLTKKQLEASLCFCAGLCLKYKIPVENVITHYEFGKANPKSSSAGKIDIVHLPPYPEVQKEDVGDFLRKKVNWYAEKINR